MSFRSLMLKVLFCKALVGSVPSKFYPQNSQPLRM